MSALDLILKNPLLLISIVLSVLTLLASGIVLLMGLTHSLLVEQRSHASLIEIDLLAENEDENETREDLADTVPMLPITWVEEHTKPSAPVKQEKAYV